jgi:hypothetical protein
VESPGFLRTQSFLQEAEKGSIGSALQWTVVEILPLTQSPRREIYDRNFSDPAIAWRGAIKGFIRRIAKEREEGDN